MPQTVCSGTMFTTPSGFSPHLACAEPGEEEEAPQEGPGPGACLAEGPPITSASLDTLIQNLVPTADYYPEVRLTPPLPWSQWCSQSLECRALISLLKDGSKQQLCFAAVVFAARGKMHVRCQCSAHLLRSSSGTKVANSGTEAVKLHKSQGV